MTETEGSGSRQSATYCKMKACWRTVPLRPLLWHYQRSYPEVQCSNLSSTNFLLAYRGFLGESSQHSLLLSPSSPFLRQFHILRTNLTLNSFSESYSYETNDHALNSQFLASIPSSPATWPSRSRKKSFNCSSDRWWVEKQRSHSYFEQAEFQRALEQG